MTTQLTGKLKSLIRQVVPMAVIAPLFGTYVRVKAVSRGCRVKNKGTYFEITDGKRAIRLAPAHTVYLDDVLSNFDYYFNGVEAENIGGLAVVDYSAPKLHKVTGFDAFPVFFPAVPEPAMTAQQYIDFAELKPGAVIIDLGAYSGLTSILFDMAIPGEGTVIAVEADRQNIPACKQNFAAYRRHSGHDIQLVEAAIWRDEKGVEFSSEGSMGSSVLSLVGSGRGESIRVPSVTLEGLVERFHLSRVDMIKCDIEGGETVIFDRPDFFAKHSPKIIIETHAINGENSQYVCAAILGKYGYSCEIMEQHGLTVPLLACTRKGH